MISIVICSRTPKISDNLLLNIAETIGVEYELIVIDNYDNKYSIFQAYNIGLDKSNAQIVCFLHDDIHLNTQNWGQILIKIFDENNDIGLIGIAGTKSKTKMPSAWWECPDEDLYMNINQYLRNGKKEHWYKGFENNDFEDVVAVDGVFMVAKKDNSISFSNQLTGFHNYDLNLSFEYLKNGYRIVATKTILLDHLSIGVLNESWYRSTLKLHKMYEDFLPLNKSYLKSSKNNEFKNGIKFINELLKLKLKKQALYLWLKLFILKPASKVHFHFFKSLFK